MDDRFEAAKALHLSGRVAEAEAQYRELLAASPANADLHNMLGNALADQQRWPEAAESYRCAVALQPDKAAAHYNLGNALSALGDLPAAVQAYQDAIARRPDYARAYFNLGNVCYDLGRWPEAAESFRHAMGASGQPDPDAAFNLARTLHRSGHAAESIAFYRAAIAGRPHYHPAYGMLSAALLELGRPKEAVQCHRRAVELDPQEPAAHFFLGRTLLALLQFDEAEAALRRVLELDPHSRDAFRTLGQLLDTRGRRRELAELAEAWLRACPDDPEAAHYQSAWTGRSAPARASDEFVRTTFDAFATDFDEVLQTLDYRAPQLLQTAAAAACADRAGRLDLLDAGCGTGWCGPLLRPLARRLTGVDLSSGMLGKARRLGAYDELVEAELTDYLQRNPNGFDGIVSADTLVYFGDLQAVLAAAARALRPGGFLAFTVEHLAAADPEPPADFLLRPHGRYGHAEAYVRTTLATSGLTVTALTREPLRKEGGQDVAGLVVVAVKPSDRGDEQVGV